jgi:DNA primase
MLYQVIELLDSILGPHKQFAKGEYYYYCPFCNHYNPKLAVNLQKQKWQCWKCAQRGRKLSTLLWNLKAAKEDIAELSRLLNEEMPIEVTKDYEQHITLPSEFEPLTSGVDSYFGKLAKAYLTARGITEADIIRYGMGVCGSGPYAYRVIIPSYDDQQRLNYFVGRTFKENNLNYLTPRISKNIIIFDNHINWQYPVVLCEGVFDAMAIKRNAIPLLGTFVPKKVMEKILKQKDPKVYLALDKDALPKTIKIAERLMKEGKEVYLIELADKDPSKLGFVQMTKLLRDATPLTFNTLVRLKMNQ